MDGFRERLSGRYDRSGMRGTGYDRMPSDDRYESDRFERTSRRGMGEGISQEALSEAVSEAVTKSNREQLDVIADFFDEAKADRMESERAIIDALSHSLSEAVSTPAPAAPVAPAPEQTAAPIVVDEQNTETLSRIERIVGQNAESLNETGEMLERNVNSLRSNSEALNDIKNSIGELLASSEDVKREIATRSAAPMQDLTVDFSAEKDEIIGAVGDNRAILNMIRQDVLNGFARNNAEEDENEKPALLSADAAANYYKELEEHVHKECVKCYRNVQSALTEQSGEANKGLEKSVGGLRIMVLVTLLLSIVSLAIQVCSILGILSF
ncbi:MAG: hypothetical protein IJ591_06460 [Lachnospiraceae bacterium]|jgi:hypothetical protein|nr:hypothetical protein [Lachnospiraceae bacterium]